MNSEPLSFDKMVVDTKIAEAFLEKHPDLKDPALTKYTTKDDFVIVSTDGLQEKLILLASLMKKNKPLFCQLEYLIRGIPVKEVEDYDWKLLINNLLYYGSCCFQPDVDQSLKTPTIIMGDHTPLVNLGWIAQILTAGFSEPVIYATKKTAAICTLFVELCQEASLPKITLEITDVVDNDDNKLIHLEKIKELQNGCAGVITRRSDIESAVDQLLHAPTTKPWAVRNIYIEESAVERFKRAISWKTNRDHESLDIVSSLCTEAYHYEGRLFLFEYVGDTRTDTQVSVHPYRTVKDLLNIIEPSLSVSLWSSDVAESNEIAAHLKTNIIWINDLGNFNGSPRTSQSFHSLLKLHHAAFKIKSTPDIQKLLKLRTEWVKEDVFVRRNAVLNFMKLNRGSVSLEMDDFVDVAESYMCTGRTLPGGLIYNEKRNKGLNRNDNMELIHFLGSIVRGHGVIVCSNIKRTSLNDYLINIGAPILCVEEGLKASADGDLTVFDSSVYRTKVVWNSYGTVFAN